MLEEVAKILKVPVDAIKKLDDAKAVNIISNTFTENSHAVGYIETYSPNFNPIDKIVELYDEKIALYERMLKDRDGMIEELRKKS